MGEAESGFFAAVLIICGTGLTIVGGETKDLWCMVAGIGLAFMSPVLFYVTTRR